jgi:hypothetical protein
MHVSLQLDLGVPHNQDDAGLYICPDVRHAQVRQRNNLAPSSLSLWSISYGDRKLTKNRRRCIQILVHARIINGNAAQRTNRGGLGRSVPACTLDGIIDRLVKYIGGTVEILSQSSPQQRVYELHLTVTQITKLPLFSNHYFLCTHLISL